MSEHGEIISREAGDDNPPGLLADLKQQVSELFDGSGESGGKWIKGKADQETAKAAEIRAGIMNMLGQLEIERERLIKERDETKKKFRAEGKKERNRHEEKMYDLETQRIEAEARAQAAKAEAMKNAVQALRELRDLGVEVTLDIVQQALLPSKKQA